jgi:hypothetical protein
MYTIKRMSRASALALVLMSSACGEAAAPAEKPVEASAGDPVPATPAAIEIVGDFTDVGNWQQLGGGPSPDSLVGGAYSFEPLIGAISRKSFPAKEGDRYAVDYTVNLVSTPTNGKEPTYVVGPMFLDALCFHGARSKRPSPKRQGHDAWSPWRLLERLSYTFALAVCGQKNSRHLMVSFPILRRSSRRFHPSTETLPWFTPRGRRGKTDDRDEQLRAPKRDF